MSFETVDALRKTNLDEFIRKPLVTDHTISLDNSKPETAKLAERAELKRRNFMLQNSNNDEKEVIDMVFKERQNKRKDAKIQKRRLTLKAFDHTSQAAAVSDRQN